MLFALEPTRPISPNPRKRCGVAKFGEKVLNKELSQGGRAIPRLCWTTGDEAPWVDEVKLRASGAASRDVEIYPYAVFRALGRVRASFADTLAIRLSSGESRIVSSPPSLRELKF